MALHNALIRLLAAACTIVLAAVFHAAAQPYPARSILVIVPFPPGGGVDTIARILQPKMQDSLGQPIVVENRPGAAAIIGTNFVAHAAPDGYTLLFTLNPHVVNKFLHKDLPYDPISDFSPISLVATTPNILVVNPKLNVASVPQLLKLAKEHPGTLNFGTAGVGSPFHLAGALFNTMADVKITDVPYKGGPQATMDLLSGRVQIMFGNLFNVLPYVKSGQLKALAVTSPKRLKLMPALPTIAESGVPGYVFESWFGVLAPAKTPANVINRVHGAIIAATKSEEVGRKIAAQGAELVGSSPGEFADFLKRETDKWAGVIKKTGLQPK